MWSLRDNSFNQRGVVQVALVFTVVIVVGLVGFLLLNKQPTRQPSPASNPLQTQEVSNNKNQPPGGHSNKQPFYQKDGIVLEHYWPSEPSFSAEETEILLFNESESNIEVKSFSLEYEIEGRIYPHKSGTWEKFPTRVSWERAEYLNISPQYYKGEPLYLARGEKGKLHWHINFGPNPLDGKQTIKLKLALLRNGQTINVDEEFNRASGTVFSKENH